MSRSVVVVGTGSYVPDNIVTNEDIINQFPGLQVPAGKGLMVPVKDFINGMAAKVGYKTRRKLKDPNETTSTLCVNAGKRALENAGIKPEDLDMIILATDSPDFISPPTSSKVQFELGAVNAGLFDVNAACAGFTTALSTGANFLKNDQTLKYVMVLGAYGMSRYADPKDVVPQYMFADGAGALILKAENSSKYGIKESTLMGDGKWWDAMGIYAGGTWKGFSEEAMKQGLHHVKFLKAFPADINIKNWPILINKTLEKTGWTAKDVDRMFFTQVNLSIILEVCKIMGWDPSISHNIMDVYGYTGSACIPMAIDDANKKGLLKAGQKIVICTSGGGAAFASLSLIWGK